MNVRIFIRLIDNLGIKETIKKIFYVFISLYKLTMFPFSVILILYFLSARELQIIKKKKLISLRITPRYFGHFAMEPAILSSIMESSNNLQPLVSIKQGVGINNQKLLYVANQCFKFIPDIILLILEHIYNFSIELTKQKINLFYQPLLPRGLVTREVTYMRYLETSRDFKWRNSARSALSINNTNTKKIIISLRTEHYGNYDSNVAPQPWRDANYKDIEHLIAVSSQVINPKSIFLHFHSSHKEIIESSIICNSGINLLDKNKYDILDIISPSSILINNGNGVGAAALSFGVKTLYIHHTLWQFWHTSHSNSIALPSDFRKGEMKGKLDLKEIISLAFSPKSIVPYDFYKNYYSNNIRINSISDIKSEILEETLVQILNDKKKFRLENELLGCKFRYSSEREKRFWEDYISSMPSELRKCHSEISLEISDSYLENFD